MIPLILKQYDQVFILIENYPYNFVLWYKSKNLIS